MAQLEAPARRLAGRVSGWFRPTDHPKFRCPCIYAFNLPPGAAASPAARGAQGAAQPVCQYRAMRAALDGEMACAGELYQQAAAHLSTLGLRQHAALVSILTRAVLLLTQD